MTTQNSLKYRDAALAFDGDCQATSLLMEGDGDLAVYYAPFDHINPNARVVLVGITPGKTQAENALAEARRLLRGGASLEDAVAGAKRQGAFSGPLRANLVAMLDHVGLPKWLGLASCSELFGIEGELMQTASVLPFPVFVKGANYSGTPNPLGVPLLERHIGEHFTPLLRALPKAVFIPLGPVPAKVLQSLVGCGHADEGRILAGIPHPSGANAERIAYFLGRKERRLLSAKTDPIKLDRARDLAMTKVAALSR